MLLLWDIQRLLCKGYFATKTCLLPMGQHCTGKNPCNIAQETPENIAQEKTQCNAV